MPYSINLPVKDEWPENRTQIEVHTDKLTQVGLHVVQFSLVVTHPSTGRGRRVLT